jgi:hypothetical protein
MFSQHNSLSSEITPDQSASQVGSHQYSNHYEDDIYGRSPSLPTSTVPEASTVSFTESVKRKSGYLVVEMDNEASRHLAKVILKVIYTIKY